MDKNEKLDEELLKQMFNAIRVTEIKNIKTQRKDDKAMVRVIEEYVRKNVQEEMGKNED